MNIFLLGIVLVVGSITAFFLPREEATKIAEQKVGQKELVSSHVAYQTDTDGDGMPDWEEGLRGTDPTRPDRPKPAQPEIIARLQEKRAETIVPVAPVIPLSSITISPPTPPVAEDEITKTSAVETAVLRAFGNSLGEALQPITNESFEQEMLAHFNAVIAKREKLSALVSVAAAYTAVSAALKETAAPAAGAALLATLSANYESLAGALAMLARGSTEPQEASKEWLRYSAATLEVGKALNETIGFFATQKILFAPTEPGAIFNIY